MTVVSGNGFFRPTPGPAHQAATPRPAATSTNAVLQAQTAGDPGRAGPGGNQPASRQIPPSVPFGPRGSIIDILA